MRGTIVCVAALLFVIPWVLLAAGDPAVTEADDDPWAAVRVAVIDLEVVFDASDQRAGEEIRIKVELDTRLKELETLELDINKLRGQIKMVKPSSEEYRRLEKSIVVKEGEFKFYQEQFRRQLEERRSAAHAKLITELRGVVDTYARDRGIDLVLQRKLPVGDGIPDWELVFFATRRLDITADIIELVNKK